MTSLVAPMDEPVAKGGHIPTASGMWWDNPHTESGWPSASNVLGQQPQDLEYNWEIVQVGQGSWIDEHPWEESRRPPTSLFDAEWLGQETAREWPNGGALAIPEDAKQAESGKLIPNIADGLGKPQAKKDLVSLEELICDERRWMVYQRQLCCYRSPCWVMLDEHRAEVEIRRILEDFGLVQALSPRDYKEIRRLMLTHPALQREEKIEPLELQLNLLDGTLDVLTGELKEHDPEDGLFNFLDVSAEEIMRATDGPLFEGFVEQLSNGNPDIRRQLLELTGVAIANCSLKQFFVLLGPSHSGKSQFGRFLEELVGHEYVETLRSIDDFGDKWTMGSLRGKKLVTCLDLPDGVLSYKAIGMIKQLAGDDSVKGECKGGEPFSFRDKPLLLCAGNFPIKVPNKEKEQAFLKRMVVIPFANPIQPDEEAQHFYKQLLAEKAYIVGQTVPVLQDLAQRNFQVTRVPVPDEYAPEEGNPGLKSAQEFLIHDCALDEAAEVTTADLLTAYRAFPGAGGISDTEFSRLLSAAIQSVAPNAYAIKRAAGTEKRGYRGLSLKSGANDGI